MTQAKKIVFFTVLGTSLEFFDFAIFAIFSTVISQVFFPQDQPLMALMSTFGVMAAGFLARPIGSLIFGYCGDKYGRKNTFTLTIFLMSLATLFTGLLPRYSSVGFIAPMLLLLCRFLQGLSIGGETAGSSIFLAEHFSGKRRGLMVSLAFAGFSSGYLSASLLSLLIHHYYSQADIVRFAWRFPFVFGSSLGLISFWIRKQVSESPIFLKYHQQRPSMAPLGTLFKHHWRKILIGVGIAAITAESSMVLLYIPAYLTKIGQFDQNGQMICGIWTGIFFILLTVLSGALGDVLGRRRLMMVSAVITLISAYPYLHWVMGIQQSQAWLFVLIYIAMATFSTGCYGCSLIELFPSEVRYSGVAFSYNISFAFFAGVVPLLNCLFIKIMSIEKALFIFLVLAALMSLIGSFGLRAEQEHGSL